jgi:hypothetical protein
MTPRSLTALAAAVAAMLPMAVHAYPIIPPPVPAILQVEDGHKPYLMAHAFGTQNYVCARSATDPNTIVWTLFGPQATLFADRGRQQATHFLSPNPDENGTARATWQHSGDSSAVWAVRVEGSSDPAYVDPNAIQWLLLRVVGREDGPSRGRKLSETSFIHRVNTVAGKAPATGCAGVDDLGKTILVPYETDYIFYRPVRRN